MKPRLPVAEITEEDFDVMKRNSQRWWAAHMEIRPCLSLIYVTGDRRDAELMWLAQRMPGELCLLRADPAAPRPAFHPHGQMIDVRGGPIWLELYEV